MSRAWLLVLLVVLCAGQAWAESRNDATTARVQLLLMLRTAPPHYRPDAAYANAYQAPGRGARRALAQRLAQAQGLAVDEDWAMPLLGVDCFVLDARDAATAARALATLGEDPRVESVQPLQRFHTLASAATAPATRGDPLYAAQPAAARWHLAELHRHATGAGVRVAVIDTGVDANHPDLRGQLALQRNFVDAGAAPAERHGTAVAGVLAARADNGVGIAGIAPRARLLALRACWQGNAEVAECDSFTLAKALQFAIERKAQVLNLSLGGGPDRLLARLLDLALQRGIVVVAASDPAQRDGGFPASHPGVLAATDVRREDVPMALWVPGTHIPAPAPGAGWALVSGSSFAAAQLSGLVALTRERAPHLDAARLLARMPRGAAIDACAVMARADADCVCNCTIASATMGATPR